MTTIGSIENPIRLSGLEEAYSSARFHCECSAFARGRLRILGSDAMRTSKTRSLKLEYIFRFAN